MDISDSETENNEEDVCDGCDDENCLHCIFKKELYENKIKEKSIDCYLKIRDIAESLGVVLSHDFTSVDIEEFVNKKK